MKKINLGSGKKKIKDFINVDLKNSDVDWDLNKTPWPFKKDSVEFVNAEHVLEHLKEPEKFFEEIWRILRKNGKARILVPHYKFKGSYSHIGHRGFYHEDAIDLMTKDSTDNSIKNNFKLIKKFVKRGRFKKWEKREIEWIIEKN